MSTTATQSPAPLIDQDRAYLRAVPEPLFDTEGFTRFEPVKRFFCRPRGNQDASGLIPAKGSSHSNMNQTQCLDVPCLFDMSGISFAVRNIHPQDVAAFFSGTIRFSFGGRRTLIELPTILWLPDLEQAGGRETDLLVKKSKFYQMMKKIFGFWRSTEMELFDISSLVFASKPLPVTHDRKPIRINHGEAFSLEMCFPDEARTHPRINSSKFFVTVFLHGEKYVPL